MATTAEIWQFLKESVGEHGFSLFDVDVPSGGRGVLRVYLAQQDQTPDGINLDDCAAVGKALSASDALDALIPGDITIEVSSPGVNRRLRRPDHFQGAVGERVKLRFFETASIDTSVRKGKTVFGTVVGFDGNCLSLKEEESSAALEIPLSEIEHANIDFIFT